jgi:hypothetical protein
LIDSDCFLITSDAPTRCPKPHHFCATSRTADRESPHEPPSSSTSCDPQFGIQLIAAMASIDRYRPPREGYQPPSVPSGSRQDKSSRSPTRRREVPPAAPTPPQHSARTSPPRQQARAGGQQSQSPSSAQTPPAAASQWSFTAEEVSSTPTILDGTSPSEERMRRAKGVNFIYQAGVMLDLPQITLWVAGVFFHRFFMRFSMVQEKGGIHHYVSCGHVKNFIFLMKLI